MWLEDWLAACLVPLAVWILVSGFDDLFVSLVQVRTRFQAFPWPTDADLDENVERRIAVFVPLWREHGVIGRMLEHNLATIRYAAYDIFVGVYPNDDLTQRAVSEVAARHPRVHMAECGNAGLTSKGDCLNWIFRNMVEYEDRYHLRFEVIVTHDAEDLVHPDALRLINWFSRNYKMVQIPVLPLATGVFEPTHGLYCDEFAEYQCKDIPVRQKLGGFLPSNGVGTGFARDALERIAETRDGKIFDPDCLTEDYENGFRLHQMGYSQVFLPVRLRGDGPVATREYFPRGFRAAIRQRSRWVAGIVLQGWEHHGCAPAGQLYWLWRDRKGLVGNLLSPFTNVLMPVGLWMGLQPERSYALPRWVAQACALNVVITLAQLGMRAWYSGRIYGFGFAMGVPARAMWGNAVNCLATLEALRQYTVARLQGRGLKWRKTAHAYPLNANAVGPRPRLGEMLVRMRCLTTAELEESLKACPPGVRLGEYLRAVRNLSEDHLYQALSTQAGVPLGMPQGAPSRAATRALPVDAVRRWRVLPYRVSVGQLLVLTPEIPSEKLARKLKTLSQLDIRFRLVRQSEFDALAAEYLPGSTRRRGAHSSSRQP